MTDRRAAAAAATAFRSPALGSHPRGRWERLAAAAHRQPGGGARSVRAHLQGGAYTATDQWAPGCGRRFLWVLRLSFAAACVIFRSGEKQVPHVKATVVGLVTPHVLRVLDLAKMAETGVNVDWHLRDAVTKTVDELGQQFNARDLLQAYVDGLQTLARDMGQGRRLYAGMLQDAVAMATRELQKLD